MNPTTISGSTFTLLKEGTTTPVTAQVSYDPASRKATLNPDVKLESGVVYTATVRGGADGVKDAAGNPLAQDHTWTFTTAKAPKVVGYTPIATKGVPRDIRPTATFSEGMDASSITDATIKLQVYSKREGKWVSVAYSVTYDAATKTATVVPGSILATSKKHRVTVTTGVHSSEGVALDQDATTSGNQAKRWTFTTGR